MDALQFELEDPEIEKIRTFLDTQEEEWVSSSDIAKGIGLESDEPRRRATKADYQRIATLTEKIGWRSKRRGAGNGFAAPEGWEPKGLRVVPSQAKVMGIVAAIQSEG